MGRMTENDSRVLQSISDRDRTDILYLYLVKGATQKDIAIEIYDDYDDFASQTISVVTRSYGFHNGRGRRGYPSLSRDVIRGFVERYAPEEYDGGLDEGSFDRYIRSCREQLERERQAEARRRAAAERARQEEARLQEEERRRAAAERARQEEETRRRAAAERARQEEEARRRAAAEQARRQEEARRQAAVDRGDHTRLMDEAFAALNAGDNRTAIRKAEQAWALSPMYGLSYIFACACDRLEEGRKAAEWADHVVEKYQEIDKQKYLELCRICVEHAGQCMLSCGRALYEQGRLGELSANGIQQLASRLFSGMIECQGGVRRCPDYQLDDLPFAEAVARAVLAWNREDDNRELLLDCAYIFMEQECYDEALQVYRRIGETYDIFDAAYDLYAQAGKCCYEMGEEPIDVLCYWQAFLAMQTEPRPLDALVYYGYEEDLLSIHDTPQIRRDLSLAKDYLSGRIPGSAFYSRYFGSGWRSCVGLDDGMDCHWYCDHNDEWIFETFVPRGRDIVQGLLRGLFGR